MLADGAGCVLAALDGDAGAMGRAARMRIEDAHSSDHRAGELEAHLAEAAQHKAARHVESAEG